MTAKLSVHKNTIEKRRRKDIANALTKRLKHHINSRDIRAYAVVLIDSEGGARCDWNTGSIVPMWGFASMINAALVRDIEETDIQETWKPPLRVDG